MIFTEKNIDDNDYNNHKYPFITVDLNSLQLK